MKRTLLMLLSLASPRFCRQTRFVLSAVFLLLVASCSGDGRLLEEAVEARNLRLDALSISAPAPFVLDASTRSVPTLFENTGRQIRLGFEALNDRGEPIALSTNNRNWISSNPAVATVDANGVLRTVATGSTMIRLQIGGVVSNQLPVGVQNAQIASIDAIEGDAVVDRCVPAKYTATGRFTDDTVRGLSNVSWLVSDDTKGRLLELPNSEIELVGLNAGDLELIAQSGGQSLGSAVTVSSSLQSILIFPDTTSMEVGQTLFLSAQGSYMTDAETKRVSITQTVDWAVEPGTAVASQTRTAAGRISLEALAEGATFVSASCGDATEQQNVTVLATGSNSDQLSFSQDNPFEIALSDGAVQLRLATGASYSSGNEVSQEADWEVRGANDGIISLNTTNAKGLITPLRVGSVTIRASYSGNFLDITVDVR